MCYFYLHQGKPFLKHLELKTCGWHNDRHSENFHCRVWARIKILVSSCKSYDHIVTPRRASSSYSLHVHTFIMHVPGGKIGSPIWALLHLIEQRWWEMKKGVKEKLIIKGEVARPRSPWTSVEHQRERECLHSLLWEHCLSMSHWSYTSSFQSWIIAVMPSVIS